MRNLGRTIRTIFILLFVILGLTTLVGQVLKGVINYEDTASVLVYAQDIRKGEQIKGGDEEKLVKFIKIPRSEIPATALDSTEGLANLYINEDVFDGEFVTHNTLSETYPFQVSYDIPSGHSLVSVKFERGDSANAWNVFEGQEITLVYTPSPSIVSGIDEAYSSEKLLDATVYSIKDAQYYVQGELEYNPTKLLYITFLVKRSDAVFISHIKDKGRLDIIQ
jgi:hypothetical protein